MNPAIIDTLVTDSTASLSIESLVYTNKLIRRITKLDKLLIAKLIAVILNLNRISPGIIANPFRITKIVLQVKNVISDGRV